MELTPDPLTDDEWKIVGPALDEGERQDAHLPAARRGLNSATRDDLTRLRDTWRSMNQGSRDLILMELALRIGIADPMGRDLSPLDVGDVATDWLDTLRGRRGKDIPGLTAVARALRNVWAARGEDATLRNLYRDRQSRRDGRSKTAGLEIEAPGPSPMIEFIAKHLIAIFGADKICPSSDPSKLLPRNVFDAACTRADTALREPSLGG